MRYYDILITKPDDDPVDPGGLVRKYSSVTPQGVNIPGALNIELDVPVFTLADATGGSYIRVWGIALSDIAGAANLNGMNIQLRGGMSKGLPLANPKQAGLLLSGQIQQAFGNWQDTTQTLDLIVQVDGVTATTPKNIVLAWRAGMTLATALSNALSVAFKGYSVGTFINNDLVRDFDDITYYESLEQLGEFILNTSRDIIKDASYSGVNILLSQKSFYIYDNGYKTKPIDIEFIDLIGQPSWIDAAVVQFKTVMRADLNVNAFVRLPKGQITTSQQSYSQFRQGSVFQGVYQITKVRHIGNFRQPDANSWVTVFDASPA